VVRIGNFADDTAPQGTFGISDGQRVLFGEALLKAAARVGAEAFCADLASFLNGGTEARAAAAQLLEEARDDARALADVRPTAPYVPGAKILCQAVNYHAHGQEAKLAPPEQPYLFVKVGSSVIGDGDPIPMPSVTRQLDFEVELAAVIGRAGRDIDEENALDHVAGYTILNDVSARDVQFNDEKTGITHRFGQNWTHGKGMDGFGPLGPWIVLSDELSSGYPLQVECRVNGEVRQSAATTDQIFQVPRLVAFASRGTTLHPGDIISTGTPAGVGMGDGRFLGVGDEIVCTIEKVGSLRNTVASLG
jgi:2-keto-4-pentenoate hydratase/2-oxohepta-3-ene-1,7-dioic acid hydratase in catechol pathway